MTIRYFPMEQTIRQRSFSRYWFPLHAECLSILALRRDFFPKVDRPTDKKTSQCFTIATAASLNPISCGTATSRNWPRRFHPVRAGASDLSRTPPNGRPKAHPAVDRIVTKRHRSLLALGRNVPAGEGRSLVTIASAIGVASSPLREAFPKSAGAALLRFSVRRSRS